MDKKSAEKFPVGLTSKEDITPKVVETLEEAIALAKEQAANSGTNPGAIMVSWRGGYVNGYGESGSASGITAGTPPTVGEPVESTIK